MANRSTGLRELALLFLRLGLTAFGGPAAHIAMMEDEVVGRRKWLTPEEFLDLLGATNLIPGPNSTEMAIHIGHRRGGWPGLVVAGFCFIVPAVLVTFGLAWLYVRFGAVPRAKGLLYGVKPVMIGVLVQAIVNLGRSALKTKGSIALGLVAVLLSFARVDELVLLLIGGAIRALGEASSKETPPPPAAPVPLPPMFLGAAGGTAIAFSPLKLFLVFAKIGAVLFGSGYVLLAYLREDLVDRYHWMTDKQLIDAVAVGQLTPGPVFSTATFIGYLVGRGPGAVLATVGIFLPAFIFVAVSGPLVPKIRHSKRARAFLDGVNIASLALMVTTTWHLGKSAVIDATTIALALVSGALLLRFRVNSTWLVIAGAATGMLSG